MPARVCWLVLSLLLNAALSTVSPNLALAAEATEEIALGETLTGEALSAFRRGVKLNAGADYVEAIVAFERGYELSQDPGFFWYIGRGELQLAHYAAAIHWLERYLAEVKTPLGPERKLLTRRVIEDLRNHTSLVTIHGAPSEAQIYINDQLVGIAPLAQAVLVDAGVVRLHVDAVGYNSYAKKFTVTVQKPMLVRVAMTKQPASWQAPAATTPAPGTLESTSVTQPESKANQTPATQGPVVQAASTASAPPKVKQEITSPTDTIGTWQLPTLVTTSIATLAAAGVGIYFYVGSRNANTLLQNELRAAQTQVPPLDCSSVSSGPCATIDHLNSKRRSDQIGAVVAFGATGVLAVASGVLGVLLWQEGSAASASAWSVQVAGLNPAFAGVELRHNF